MLYFLVWEIYSADWILVKKGNVFLRLDEGQDRRRQCVVTSIQPIQKLEA